MRAVKHRHFERKRLETWPALLGVRFQFRGTKMKLDKGRARVHDGSQRRECSFGARIRISQRKLAQIGKQKGPKARIVGDVQGQLLQWSVDTRWHCLCNRI